MSIAVVVLVVVGLVFGVWSSVAARQPKREALLVAASLILIPFLTSLAVLTLGLVSTDDALEIQAALRLAVPIYAVIWILIRGRHIGAQPSVMVLVISLLNAATGVGIGSLSLISLVAQTAVLAAFVLFARRGEAVPVPRSPAPPPAPAPQVTPSAEPFSTRVPQRLKIFMSYRRDDSADVSGRIYDRLVQRFGREQVFKDVDSIPLGVDFRKHLHQTVGSCDILVAVIGNQWLAGTASGVRRLDDPKDFVRIELEAALQRDIPVVPLLVRGAEVPGEAELPASLAPLSYRNGIPVRPDPDFHRDMDRLIEGLEAHQAGQV